MHKDANRLQVSIMYQRIRRSSHFPHFKPFWQPKGVPTMPSRLVNSSICVGSTATVCGSTVLIIAAPHRHPTRHHGRFCRFTSHSTTLHVLLCLYNSNFLPQVQCQATRSNACSRHICRSVAAPSPLSRRLSQLEEMHLALTLERSPPRTRYPHSQTRSMGSRRLQLDKCALPKAPSASTRHRAQAKSTVLMH